MPPLTFEDLASALDQCQGLRSVVEYTYQNLVSTEETETYLVSNRGSEPIRVIALPPRVMELQVGMSVNVNGRTAPVLPSGVVAAMIMGVLSEAGNPDELVQAAGRVFAGGQQRGARKRTAQEEADISRVARAISAVQSPAVQKALRTLLKRARSDKYVPFVVAESALSQGQMVVVAFKRGQRARHTVREYFRAVLVGRFRARQKLHVGGAYSTHLYLSPPPGAYVASTEVPQHWPAGAAKSTRKGNLWHLYLGVEGKKQIWKSRDDTSASPHGHEWYASADFSTQPMTHIVLAVAFITLTLGSAMLGTVDPSQIPARLFPLNALVGTMILPLIWASRDHDLQLAYLGSRGLLAVLIAIGWLAAGLSGLHPTWLIVAGGFATGLEIVLAFANRGRNA